jgi:hypothetical protein
MAANGMAPFAEFLGQGVLFAGQGLGLQVLEPMVHQVQGVVYQLGRLLGGHGGEYEEWAGCSRAFKGPL